MESSYFPRWFVAVVSMCAMKTWHEIGHSTHHNLLRHYTSAVPLHKHDMEEKNRVPAAGRKA